MIDFISNAAGRNDSNRDGNAAGGASSDIANRGPVGSGSGSTGSAAAASTAAAADPTPSTHAGLLGSTPAVAAGTPAPTPDSLSLSRQRSEEVKEEVAKLKPRGRLVVVSYQLPVKLIKIERKESAADSADSKKAAGSSKLGASGGSGSGSGGPRPLAAFGSGKVKFDPADIDIGEDSDNEDYKAAKKAAKQKGGSFAAASNKKFGAGAASKEPRYTVQWDDARNFLSNLRVMQAQYATSANAANAQAIAEGKAQSYYPSDVQWVGVPNIQTSDKDEMEEITQLLEKCM